MDSERDTHDEGEPTGESGPSNPDESVPSEADAEKDLPGVPDEANGDAGDDPELSSS
jgi:hypothetical protein